MQVVKERINFLDQPIAERIKGLKKAKIDGMPIINMTICSQLAVSKLIGVTEKTIITWRETGVIHPKEISKGMLTTKNIWSYDMKELITDLEKYIKE